MIVVNITALAFWIKDKKYFIGRLLQLTAVILLTVIASDWWIFGNDLFTLWQDGYSSTFGLQAGLLLFSAICVWVASVLIPQSKKDECWLDEANLLE